MHEEFRKRARMSKKKRRQVEDLKKALDRAQGQAQFEEVE